MISALATGFTPSNSFLSMLETRTDTEGSSGAANLARLMSVQRTRFFTLPSFVLLELGRSWGPITPELKKLGTDLIPCARMRSVGGTDQSAGGRSDTQGMGGT